MELQISFPGGKRVQAEFNGLTVLTDQPLEHGGDGSAPSPFELFIASLGTCAGFYVLAFCQQRNIPTTGIRLLQQAEFTMDADGKRRLANVAITIQLPAEFPEKYRQAVVKSAEVCTVKKALADPPQIQVRSVVV